MALKYSELFLSKTLVVELSELSWRYKRLAGEHGLETDEVLNVFELFFLPISRQPSLGAQRQQPSQMDDCALLVAAVTAA